MIDAVYSSFANRLLEKEAEIKRLNDNVRISVQNMMDDIDQLLAAKNAELEELKAYASGLENRDVMECCEDYKVKLKSELAALQTENARLLSERRRDALDGQAELEAAQAWPPASTPPPPKEDYESAAVQVMTSQGYGIAHYNHQSEMWRFVYRSWYGGLNYAVIRWCELPGKDTVK